MRINILTENDKVEQVREVWVNKNVMKIPCSSPVIEQKDLYCF